MTGSDGLAARSLALEALAAVEAGGHSDRVLDEVLSRGDLGDRDRRLVTEIVYGTLRRQRGLDRTLRPYSRRPWERLDGDVRAALRMAAYQCAFTASVPPHAAVDRTVEALKQRRRSAAGFANAVLRAWLRDGGDLDPGDGGRADRLELPGWLAARWEGRASAAAERWLRSTLDPAPLALRLHPGVADPEDTIRSLRRDGVETEPSRWVSGALLVRSGDVLRSSAFRTGAVSPRSEAAQLVTELLDADEGPVLDACAGRGGKTVQLGEARPGQAVVAADVDPRRLAQARRAGRAAGVRRLWTVVADLAEAAAPFRRRFPAVLVDVPCTGLGTIRRHPEIKWRIDEADVSGRATLQRRILDSAVGALAAGGRLLYVSCSTEPEENGEVVEAVLEGRRQLFREPLEAPGREELVDEDGCVRTWLADPDLDGFFAASIRRRQATA